MSRLSPTSQVTASRYLALLIAAAVVAGCAFLPPDGAEEENRIPGHYELSKYLARGGADGLYDAIERDSVQVEMTLTEDGRVRNGRWFDLTERPFKNCPPEGKREIRFHGVYAVSGDTITITLDEGCYQVPGREWLFRSDTLINLSLRNRAFFERMEMVKAEEQ